MSEETDGESARIKAIVALTQSQIEGTEVHERYSLLIMGYVGALAGYLFGSKGFSASSGYEDCSVILFVISLVCSMPAFLLGHVTASMRIGFRSDRLKKLLEEFEPAIRDEAMDAAGRWLYDKLPLIDRFFVRKLLMESGRSGPDRVEAACALMVTLESRQSSFMRLQLLFAAGATIALVLSRL